MRESHHTPPRARAASAEARYRCEACDAQAARDVPCEACGHTVMLDLHNPHDVQYRAAQQAVQQARRRTRIETAALLGIPIVLLALLAASMLVVSTTIKLVLGCVVLIGALLWTMHFFY